MIEQRLVAYDIPVFRNTPFLNSEDVHCCEGDMEADYLRFLAKVQKAAREKPVDVEFDFP